MCLGVPAPVVATDQETLRLCELLLQQTAADDARVADVRGEIEVVRTPTDAALRRDAG